MLIYLSIYLSRTANIYNMLFIFLHLMLFLSIYLSITYYEYIHYAIHIYPSNDLRMLRAILKKSWRQHPTRHQLYGHLPPITKTIQVRRTRHAGHSWRSRDELIRDVFLWTPTHGRAKAGRPARTYIQQLCEDTGCCPEDLPEAMNDREKWRERVRDIRATSTTCVCVWSLVCACVYSKKEKQIRINLYKINVNKNVWHM